jgi:hypothetical protein
LFEDVNSIESETILDDEDSDDAIEQVLGD